MGFRQRLPLIKKIEEQRDSRVICYLTGDRTPDLSTRIAMDVFPFFYDLLGLMKNPKNIDLMIYSTGGLTMAAWGLVNLVREFCESFRVLIPFKAHSTATLIALGADEIIMSKMGQLSPVDPTITSPFNPQSPVQVEGQPPSYLPVSVEDVISFLDLVREEVKIKEEQHLAEFAKVLSSDVRPLALGSVYRAKQQIGMLARKLLAFHTPTEEEESISRTVEMLTRKLYSHDYLIGRKEAKSQIGLKVSDCPIEFEGVMMDLFKEYSNELELNKPYNHQAILGNQSTKVVSLSRACIETTDRTYMFKTRREVKKVSAKQQGLTVEGFQDRNLEDGWYQDSRGD